MSVVTKPWTRWLARIQWLLVLVMIAGVVGIRFEYIPFRLAFSGFAFALLGAAALGTLALLVLAWTWWSNAPKQRSGAGWSAGVGLAPLVIIVVLVGPGRLAAPPIHDISTDTDNPPEFVAAKKERNAAENTLDYPGDGVASLQHRAYSDIQPMYSGLTYTDAYKHSLSVVEGLGWRVLDDSMEEGRIEATVVSQVFGFKDDVVIRVSIEDEGSRIDIRSVSRVGVSDLGANAERIRRFQAAFKR